MMSGGKEGRNMVETTACVIVRNEEKNIPRWLECMGNLASELVVVDTGSTDGTVKLAEKAGARVFSYMWQGDFAAAKNYAIAQARGRWIYFLDADEYFLEKDYVQIRKKLRQYDKQENILGFVCRLINIDEDDNDRVINESMHIRIFRNDALLRYVGAVHEQLIYKGQGKKEMRMMDKAVIYHTGYSSGITREKAERNLKILQAQAVKGQAQPTDICYMADAYYALGDYKAAAQEARKAIDQNVVLPGRETRMYGTLIQSLSLMGEKWENIKEIVQQAEKDYPHVPDFRALLGMAAWQQGAKKEAIDFFEGSKKIYTYFLQHRQEETATYPDEMQGMLPKIEAMLQEMDNDNMKERRGKVKISAAVIVKNEEEDLPIWLESMRGLADEMIVVDTGSTDNTVSIARKAGAQVYDFPWIDDFAAAKNYAIEKTHGDWIILLDADEYIKPEDYVGVRKTIERYDDDARVIGFLCKLVNIDKNRNNAYKSSIYQIRVFRRLDDFRYKGMIHEALSYSGTGKKEVPYIDAFTIYHTGYSSGINKKKNERNLRLLQKSQEKYGKRPLDDMYFADCYYGLGEYDKAISYAKEFVHGNYVDTVGMGHRYYGVWLQSLIYLGESLTEIRKVAQEALKKFPYGGEVYILEGHACYNQGDYLRAEFCYREAERIYREAINKEIWEKGLQTDEMTVMLPHAYGRLCQILLWQGNMDEAWHYLQEALSIDKYIRMNLKLLQKFMSDKDDVYLISVLNQLYDKTKDAKFILSCLPRRGRDKVRLYFEKQDGDGHLWSDYLLAGRLEAASALLVEDLSWLWQLGIRSLTHDESLMNRLWAIMPERYRAVIIGKPRNYEERCLARITARMQAGLEKQDERKNT